jgi:DNA polymerase-4/protein ImuB
MPLQEALAHCPTAVLLELDWPCYQAAYTRMLDALSQHSPVVEEAEPGLAYVGLDGLARLYPDQDRLHRWLLDAAPLPACLGVAGSRFVACLAARSAPTGGVTTVGEDAANFLAPFPVENLPVAWQVIARLHSFGLHSLGDIARLDCGPLQAQFGPPGRLAWELSQGIDNRPLQPRRPQEQIEECLSFASPVITIEALLLAIEALLGRAFARPAMRGRGVRAASIEASVSRAAPFTNRINFKPPATNKERAYCVMKSKLGGARLPGPLEDLRLTLSNLTGEVSHQDSFFLEVRQREQLQEAARQLRHLLGGKPALYRIRMVEPWSRIPERRMALVEYDP